jgi:hypothetical protein
MIPLETKLAKWRGTSELAYRPIKKSLERDRILSFAQTKTSANFDTSMMKWLLEKWPREGERYFCSELVALTLQEVGVLSQGKRSSSFSPKDLAFGKLESHFKTILLRE